MLVGGATIEHVMKPDVIKYAANQILNRCVIGSPGNPGGQVMNLGMLSHSYHMRFYSRLQLQILRCTFLPASLSIESNCLCYVTGRNKKLSVRIQRYDNSKVHCGALQITPDSCRVVIDSMPVSYRLQKFGPSSDVAVDVALPWSLERSFDTGK